MKILIIEDDRFLDSAYKAEFARLGFDVRIAMNGDEATDVLRVFMPDVILLDLVMPKKDGFAVLKDFKKDEALMHIPIIVTTNLSQKEDHDEAMRLGASDYIIKSDMPMSALTGRILKAIQRQ